MFTHVMVGANDLAASKKFYDAVLGAIGLPAGQADPKGRIFYRTKTGVFGITKPIDSQPATYANGGTIGFACAPALSRRRHSTTPASPTVARASRTRPAGVKAPASSILPTCAIHRAIRFARCIAAECVAKTQ
jgi:catechol 2,3-dioxygenase-like lactoylglutathione lyase family enzyme